MSYTIIRPTSHEGWLAERQKGIGSSEVATILGVNPWETPLQLWRRKKGLDPAKDMNDAMLMGHLLEDAVAKRWEIETGLEVIDSSAGDWIMVDDDRPFLRVSPDRTYWLRDQKHNKHNKGIVEIKTTQIDVDADTLPQYWFCQLQYQLGVSGFSEGWLAWLKFGRDFGTKHFDFNADFYEWMRGELEKFWRDNICGNKEPEALSVNDVMLKNPRHLEGKVVEASDEIIEAYSKLKSIKSEIAKLSSTKDELEDALKMAIGDAEALMMRGMTIATWKSSKDSEKFDEKAFAAAHTDLHSQYMKHVAGARRFVLK